MPESSFRVVGRFQEFFERSTAEKSAGRRTLLYLAGWLVAFVSVLLPDNLAFPANLIAFTAFVLFWFRLSEEVHKRFNPPIELFVLLLHVLIVLEVALIGSKSLSAYVWGPDSNLFFRLLQCGLLAGVTLLLSLIVVQNCDGRKGSLVWLTLICGICTGLLNEGTIFYNLITQAILFVAMIRYTRWLEQLTKAECWVYLLVFVLGLQWFWDVDMSGSQAIAQQASDFWFTGPSFFIYLSKMYLLALAIKIPMVLVYNFASLSRKLHISSLFQSTFPQLIQLGLLMGIFYFFIVGWQAENLRLAITQTVEQVQAGEHRAEIDGYLVDRSDEGADLSIPGYRSFELPGAMPEYGVIALEEDLFYRRDTHHYVFSHVDSDSSELWLVRLDSMFLREVSQNLSLLAGTQLTAYPKAPSQWESFVYQFSLGDLSFWGEDGNLQIFPFGLQSKRAERKVTVALTDSVTTSRWQPKIGGEPLTEHGFAAGRVVASVIDARDAGVQFVVFDILFLPDFTTFTSTLISFTLFLIILYFLVNLLITRRMVKFGSEINRIIVRKFNRLKDGIREISSGNLDYKVHIDGQDEFVELAGHFNQMGDKLKASISEARDKERLKHELTIARKVQLDLLPRILPDVPGFEVAATLSTAAEVGGDFYDVIKLDESRYLFTVGDVSGKGTSAAFYMAQCISLIRYSPQFTDNPHEIVQRLNTYFSGPMVDPQVFVTAIVGLLDLKKNSVRLVRAGHTLPMLVRGNGADRIEEIHNRGMGIGLEKTGVLFQKTLEESEIELGPGDMLLFYTDGVEEAARAASNAPHEAEFYTTERLKAELLANRSACPVEVLKHLTDDITGFYGGSEQVDDYTILILKRPGESETTTIEKHGHPV